LRARAASCLASCVAARLGSARAQTPSPIPPPPPRHPSPPPPPRSSVHSSPSTPPSLSQARARPIASRIWAASPRAPGGCDLTRVLGARLLKGARAANGVIGGPGTGSEAMRRGPELPLLLAAALLALAAAPGPARAATDAADGTLALSSLPCFFCPRRVGPAEPPLACSCSAACSIARWFRACMRGGAGCSGFVAGSGLVGGEPTAPKQGDRTGSSSCGVRCGCCTAVAALR